MSQNIANTGLPTPAATQDWTTVLDEAIQSASHDDKKTADTKKECKAAEEAAACERAEAECWEKEHWDRKECSYAMDLEMEYYEALLNHQQAEEDQEMNRQSKMLVVDRPSASVPVPAESGGPGPAEGLRAKGKGAKKKKKQVPEEAMSPRAVYQSSHRPDTSKMAKHWEMAKETQCMQRQFNNHLYELLQETEYQQVAEVEESSDKESTGEERSNRETDEDAEGEEAPESDLESKTKSKGNRSNIESSLPVLVASTRILNGKQSPQGTVGAGMEGPEVPEEGDSGDMNRSFKYHEGTEIESQGVWGSEGGNECWGEEVQGKNIGEMLEQDDEENMGEWITREVSVGNHEGPKDTLSEKVWSVAKPESENLTRTKSVTWEGWSWRRQLSAGMSKASFAKSKGQEWAASQSVGQSAWRARVSKARITGTEMNNGLAFCGQRPDQAPTQPFHWECEGIFWLLVYAEAMPEFRTLHNLISFTLSAGAARKHL
ncbi:hypothetical protein EDC04DRAFT_2600086 [Pisolithus marmoratus]|nr:hypothetical protein EDC04DRAFT_2600086 [Pisolithus marmoratus]